MRFASTIHQNVHLFEIAMYNAAPIRIVNRIGYFDKHAYDSCDIFAQDPHKTVQIGPVYKVHYQKESAIPRLTAI